MSQAADVFEMKGLASELADRMVGKVKQAARRYGLKATPCPPRLPQKSDD